MEPLTYCLYGDVRSSKEYYQKAESLAKVVLLHANHSLKPLWEKYNADESSLEHPFAREILELLLLGVLYQKIPKTGGSLLSHLEKTVASLEVWDDYLHQAKVLQKWELFLKNQSVLDSEIFLKLILSNSSWFIDQASSELGRYTARVPGFLSESCEESPLNPDFLWHQSEEKEYHLNMAGAEIFNLILRPEFLQTKKRLVVLPGCLRSSRNCKAREWKVGYKCNHCNENCLISRVTEIASEKKAEVAFVIHQSSLTSHIKNLNALNRSERLGIIGVSCALSLLEGGYMLDFNNIPAQCVPLDYSGCKKHWHQSGISTSLNLERLDHLLSL